MHYNLRFFQSLTNGVRHINNRMRGSSKRLSLDSGEPLRNRESRKRQVFRNTNSEWPFFEDPEFLREVERMIRHIRPARPDDPGISQKNHNATARRPP